jgi:hypothetical protein
MAFNGPGHAPPMTPKEHDEERPTGFPEPPGDDPGDRSHDDEAHHVLNNPIDDPDETEWPDPYERREDPRGAPGPGGPSTSEPHPSQDPEAEPSEPPERDKLDE